MTEYIVRTDGHEGHWFTGEEIVRCRDCKYRCNDECTRIDEGFKDYWFAIEPNGFCKWSERRSNDR